MRVLFLSRLFWPHIGGVEKHVLEISKRLVKKGYEVIVVTEQLSPAVKQEGTEGIKVVRIKVGKDDWFKKFRIWRELWRHKDLIKNADIIHCHDVFFWYFPFRFLFPAKKVFTTFHGYEGNKIPGRKAILMHKIAEVLSFGNICVGDFLKKWYKTAPTYTTFGGVKISNIKYEILKIDREELRVLFIGRLEEEAGIMQYLEALKILKEYEFKFTITILGDGSLRKEAEKFSKINNLDADFKGFVENVQDYLPKADFVFTSRYLGILEAMAAKKTVFAHYNNSIKEDYLKMSPFAKWIVIENSPENLAEKLKSSVEDKKKSAENIDKAYEWVKKQTWEEVVRTYEKLWKS